MHDIPFDRSFLQLSNGIRHIMPSTDRKLELTAKSSMAQPRLTAGCVLQCVNFSVFGHQTSPQERKTTFCV